jgi:glutamine synthetase
MSHGEVQIQDAESLHRALSDAEISHVMVGVVDLDGALRAKQLSVEKVRKGLEGELRFCDVVLGFDSNDEVYENTTITGWHTGFPDVPVRLAPETWRPLPGERRSYLLLADYGGRLEPICPRAVLRRVLERARDLGLRVLAGFEYEFRTY